MHQDFQHSTHGESWDGEDRRQYQVAPPVAPKAVHGEPVTKEYLDHSLSEWKLASRAYFNAHFERLEKKIEDGFPEGNTTKHREVHERYIAQAADREALWKSIREKVLTGAVYAALIAVLTAVWQYIKADIHKP